MRFEEEYENAVREIHENEFRRQCMKIRMIELEADMYNYPALPELREAFSHFKLIKKPIKIGLFNKLVADWNDRIYFDYNLFYKEVNYAQ